jgi:hypothetical protein
MMSIHSGARPRPQAHAGPADGTWHDLPRRDRLHRRPDDRPGFWKRLGDKGFDRERSVPLELAGDGKVRTQVLALGDSPGYRGLITGLAIESGPPSRPGQTLRLHSIEPGPANSGK